MYVPLQEYIQCAGISTLQHLTNDFLQLHKKNGSSNLTLHCYSISSTTIHETLR